MIKFAPKAQLSAIVNNWGAYYVERTNAMMNGSWKSQDVWHGLKEGMVQMAPYTNMSSDAAALAKKTEDAIRSGALHPFSGPIKDQSGKLVVKAGEIAEAGMLLGMNFYVEGVQGSLPK